MSEGSLIIVRIANLTSLHKALLSDVFSPWYLSRLAYSYINMSVICSLCEFPLDHNFCESGMVSGWFMLCPKAENSWSECHS